MSWRLSFGAWDTGDLTTVSGVVRLWHSSVDAPERKMIRAILALAVRRLRGRGSATALLIAAVAAASGTTLTIANLGTAAGDRAVQDALAALDPGDRSLPITGFAPSSDHAAELDAHAEAAFAPAVGLIGPVQRGVILRSVPDPAAPHGLQLVAADDPAGAGTLADGQP